MEHVREAIVVNNAAVRSMLGGHGVAGIGLVSSTIQAFQRAVAIMRLFHAEVAKSVPVTREASRLPGVERTSFCFECNSGKLDGFHGEHGFVYNRPLFLPSFHGLEDDEELEWYGVIASTTCLFNLALAWHNLSVSTGRDKPVLVATKLYALVLSVLHQVEETSSCGGNPSLAVLECLVLNNLSQLSCVVGDYRRCDSYMMDLSIQLASTSSRLEDGIGCQNANEIMLNVCHWQPPIVAHAA